MYEKVNMLQLAYLTLLCMVEILGDFALEKYAHEKDIEYLGLGILGYLGVVFFLVLSLQNSTILYVNGMWDGISGFIESAAAYFILGERFERTEQYFGLGLIIMGMFLLHEKEK